MAFLAEWVDSGTPVVQRFQHICGLTAKGCVELVGTVSLSVVEQWTDDPR
jgi:hypothetical protein